MTQHDNFEEILQELAEYAEIIGNEVLDSNIDNIMQKTILDEEYSFNGHRCKHGDNIYLIGGHPDIAFFDIAFFFSLQHNIANSLPEAFVNEKLEDEEDHEERLNVAQELLNDIDRSVMVSLNKYTYLTMAGGSVATSLTKNEMDSLIEFNATKKIFPRENDFYVSDFEFAVQSVVSTGSRGISYVANSLRFELDEDDPGELELAVNL